MTIMVTILTILTIDHATGFPSIEGALMAISFLTFAVYLIRLVMVIVYLQHSLTNDVSIHSYAEQIFPAVI